MILWNVNHQQTFQIKDLLRWCCLFAHLNKSSNKKTNKRKVTAIINYYPKEIIMKIFMTFNPHIENLSQRNLMINFRKSLQKYYRKTLGSRYFKHKDRQYQIGVFQEVGSRDFKQPHLHIIIDLPLNKVKELHHFLSNELKNIYPSLTTDCQIIKSGKYDEQNVYFYCLKEGQSITTNSDLYLPITDFN